MDKQLAIRRVRIAMSVFFGVLTMALCLLWVRSYWYEDTVARSVAGGTYSEINSNSGRITVSRQLKGYEGPSFWGHRSQAASGLNRPRPASVSWFSRLYISAIRFPHWIPVFATGAISICCWIPFSLRFSLRAMFIATTLSAVALGLGVWLTR